MGLSLGCHCRQVCPRTSLTSSSTSSSTQQSDSVYGEVQHNPKFAIIVSSKRVLEDYEASGEANRNGLMKKVQTVKIYPLPFKSE